MHRFIGRNKIRAFKVIEGKNYSTTFLPLNANIGGQTKPDRYNETKYLTEDQARYIYKKVELGNVTDIGTIKKGMDQY